MAVKKSIYDIFQEAKRIGSLKAHLEGLMARFESDGSGYREVHPHLPDLAASPYDALPGTVLMVVTGGKPVEIKEVRIERIELQRFSADDSLEPCAIDQHGVVHTWQSLGLMSNSKGEWGDQIPIVDSGPLSLIVMINWLTFEYGESATNAVSYLQERLRSRHNFLAISSVDAQLLSSPASYSC